MYAQCLHIIMEVSAQYLQLYLIRLIFGKPRQTLQTRHFWEQHLYEIVAEHNMKAKWLDSNTRKEGMQDGQHSLQGPSQQR